MEWERTARTVFLVFNTCVICHWTGNRWGGGFKHIHCISNRCAGVTLTSSNSTALKIDVGEREREGIDKQRLLSKNLFRLFTGDVERKLTKYPGCRPAYPRWSTTCRKALSGTAADWVYVERIGPARTCQKPATVRRQIFKQGQKASASEDKRQM